MPTPLTWPLIPDPPPADPVSPAIGFLAASYLRQLKLLMPRGAAFLLEADSYVTGLLTAIADELARIDARALDLIEETDPRTADETLADWERVLGLPDDCVGELAATEAERRLVVTQKWIARGDQRPAYFVGLALAVGVTATVEEFWARVLRVGFRVGDRVYGIDQAFSWAMNFTGSIASGLLLPVPVISESFVYSGSGTLLDLTEYAYQVSARNAQGETIASAIFYVDTGASGGMNDNSIEINWTAIAGAVDYRVFGRLDAGPLYMATVTSPTWEDTGAVTPSGALPAANTSRTAKALSLECVVSRAKPAHTTVTFTYGA